MNQPNENNQIELVFSQENEIYTTSLIIAKVFEKNHFDVLRAIEKLSCSKEFRASNFAVSSYKSLQGKEMPMCKIYKDGVSLLIMGFTGENAMKWKELYIKAFNDMEKKIRELLNPKSFADMLIEAGNELKKKDIIIKEKDEKLLEQAPKVEGFNIFLDTSNLMTVSEFANQTFTEFGLGLINMFKKLRELGIIQINNTRPKQCYIDEGYFKVKSNVIKGLNESKPQTFITKKGVEWLYNKLKKELKK